MSPKKSKAADVVAEAPAQSAEVDLREATSAADESKPVEPGELVCGPLRLKRDPTGYGWAQNHVGHPPPQPAVRVNPGPHGWQGIAALGQAGLVKTTGTNEDPQRAAAELESTITAALEAVRQRQAAVGASIRAGRESAQEARLRVSQADRDLLIFAERVGWTGA
ncbi:MAG: hypothetical protein KC492_28445 [Myxococcales bacterium]|nr:hypothetical protein [Myxococcales bacterium]